MNGMQESFHFASIEEIVRPDEENPAIGQHFGLVVED
jgi:hypothetical protein